MPPEIVLGRAVALCVHPYVAWRLLPVSGRVLLLTAYAGASYVAVLTTLLLL